MPERVKIYVLMTETYIEGMNKLDSVYGDTDNVILIAMKRLLQDHGKKGQLNQKESERLLPSLR